MFDSLSSKFAGAFSALRSRGKISEKDIDATTADIRQALLEADVALDVVESFTRAVHQKSIDVLPTLQSGTNQAQAIFDVVNQELTEILGGGARRVRLAKNPPTVIMLAGLQGAGKTTLFDVISGYTPLQDGTIDIAGHDVTKSSPTARANFGLGRSFQDARLFPELSVRETLAVSLERWVKNRSALAAAMYLPPVFDSEEAITTRVNELVELLGLGDYQNKFIRELSTGTRRIVDLACLVAHRPSVILLDEPSSGLAQREVEALTPVVRRLRDDLGSALVIIEHDIAFISGVADRLIALDQGRVIADGVPHEVLEHPIVIESYLGTSSAAIARSGQGG